VASGPPLSVISQGRAVDQAFSTLDEALELCCARGHNGAEDRALMCLSISVPSRDRRGPSHVSVRGLGEESGARRGHFRDQRPLLSE